MAKVVPPGFADVTVNISRDGDPDVYANVFGVDLATPPWTVEEFRLALEGWANALAPLLATTERFSGAVARIGQDGGDPTVLEIVMNIPGTAATQRLPQNCAVLVKKITTLGGRRGRGRLFWPSIGELSVDNVGNLATDTTAAYQERFDAAYVALTVPAGGVQSMVLLHNTPPLGGAVPAPTPVTSLKVAQLLATQRRRLRK